MTCWSLLNREFKPLFIQKQSFDIDWTHYFKYPTTHLCWSYWSTWWASAEASIWLILHTKRRSFQQKWKKSSAGNVILQFLKFPPPRLREWARRKSKTKIKNRETTRVLLNNAPADRVNSSIIKFKKKTTTMCVPCHTSAPLLSSAATVALGLREMWEICEHTRDHSD